MIDWIKKLISSPWETIKDSYRTFEIFEERLDRHHTFMLASGIAFNILLYLLPLFLILVVLVRMFFGEQGIIQIFHDIMLEFLPPTADTYNLIDTITKEIEVLVSYSSVFGIIGAVSLLWLFLPVWQGPSLAGQSQPDPHAANRPTRMYRGYDSYLLGKTQLP